MRDMTEIYFSHIPSNHVITVMFQTLVVESVVGSIVVIIVKLLST